ncbi:hypothetical protein GCM10009630_71880 [Kribbella jejuensis]|uniref:Uncharacterized protein n=1 Tax=Kribbella jejuensis TaxID=236068 RepID=A0A542DB30_9ACTN|nr:hypothetical protein [Kribbella jejuensis]TQJ00279.1 hypothetical protein FB475_7274 [Kribbella jejuensis]
MVMMTGSLAVSGMMVWLTPQQGGRVSGPPEPDYDYDYTATAYLPPRTAEDGQVGVALRRFAPGAWRTPAEGILVPAKGNRAQQVIPGCIVVVTEGVRPVGLLTVEEVHVLAPDGTPVVPAAAAPVDTPPVAADTPTPTDPPYRHSTAASRWTSRHASDDVPSEPAGV